MQLAATQLTYCIRNRLFVPQILIGQILIQTGKRPGGEPYPMLLNNFAKDMYKKNSII